MSRALANPCPPTSNYISFLLYHSTPHPPTPPESRRHMCITPNMKDKLFNPIYSGPHRHPNYTGGGVNYPPPPFIFGIKKALQLKLGPDNAHYLCFTKH